MNGPSPDLRASDADRERVAERLRAAGEDGRLDVDELEDRLTKAYAARTFGDLAPLTADLAAPAPEVPPVAASSARGTADWRVRWGSWLGTSILLVGVWAIVSISSGDLQFFWPIFPIGFWGLGLLASLFTGDSGRGDGDGGSPYIDPPPPPPRS